MSALRRRPSTAKDPAHHREQDRTPGARAQVDKIESYLNAAVQAAVARLRGEAEVDTNIEI